MAKYTNVELLDAYCRALGYQEQVDDGQGGLVDNPESKVDFLSRTEREHAARVAIRQLQREQVRAAKEDVKTRADGVNL